MNVAVLLIFLSLTAFGSWWALGAYCIWSDALDNEKRVIDIIGVGVNMLICALSIIFIIALICSLVVEAPYIVF